MVNFGREAELGRLVWEEGRGVDVFGGGREGEMAGCCDDCCGSRLKMDRQEIPCPMDLDAEDDDWSSAQKGCCPHYCVNCASCSPLIHSSPAHGVTWAGSFR